LNGSVLIVDDERSMCELLDTDLRLRGFSTESFTSAADAWQALANAEYDVVLTDVKMPGTSGIELCTNLASHRPDVPVVVMTAFGSLDAAIAAIRAGAYDFVTKPIEMDLLAVSLQRAVKHRRMQQRIRRLSETVEHSSHFGELVGDSPAMQELYSQLARLAESDTSVLITGESGTGKELVARCIHRRSRRGDGPFVAVNCAALPESLLESELFGHAKGSFTDARADRKGLFLQAEEGTLFLDEIGELPLNVQAKLLRALEERTVRPVGSDREIPFDVRLISATNRDLESAVEDDRFRDDLYYRINVIQVDLPPLRARGGDVLLLAAYYTQTFATQMNKAITGIAEPAAERLLNYNWPGNVRELRNAIERAVALTRFDKITLEDLPGKIRDFSSSQLVIAGHDPADFATLEEVERRYILHVLEAFGGNRTQTSRILGLDRKTLYRKLKQYGIAEREE
jgi:two-component system response regulator HydG